MVTLIFADFHICTEKRLNLCEANFRMFVALQFFALPIGIATLVLPTRCSLHRFVKRFDEYFACLTRSQLSFMFVFFFHVSAGGTAQH